MWLVKIKMTSEGLGYVVMRIVAGHHEIQTLCEALNQFDQATGVENQNSVDVESDLDFDDNFVVAEPD